MKKNKSLVPLLLIAALTGACSCAPSLKMVRSIFFFKVLIILLVAKFSFAKEREAGFLIDYSLSPHASATTFIGINRALSGFEDYVFEKKHPIISAPIQIALRTGELLVVWLPVNYFSMLIQHEFFGHAVSTYQFNARPIFFFKDRIFNLPPPFGLGVIGTGIRGKNGSEAKDYIVTLSGVNAADVFSDRLAFDWAKQNRIEGRLAFLYILNSLNASGYIYLKNFIDFGQGNDIVHYQARLNSFLKYDDLNSKDALRDAYLYSAAATNFLDPLLYWSFYALFEYARSGSDVGFPWITFSDNFRYLPRPRAILSPFGPEFYLDNYFELYGRTMRIYPHMGMLATNIYGGFGIEGEAFKWRDLTVGGKIEIFSQPKLDLDARLKFSDDGKKFLGADRLFGGQIFGALGILKASYLFLDTVSLNTEVGYKSQGFAPGEWIASSFILRAGLSLRM